MRLITFTALMIMYVATGSAKAYEDRLPDRFLGVWMMLNDERSSCTKQDWKGDTATDDGIYLFEPRLISGIEYGCTLMSSRPIDGGTVEAMFECGGEGYHYKETQELSRASAGSKQLLIQKSKASRPVDDFGHFDKSEKWHEKIEIHVYQKCIQYDRMK